MMTCDCIGAACPHYPCWSNFGRQRGVFVPIVYEPTWAYTPLATGWECPRCGKVHAPTVTECDCKRAGG